jgi:hypothetical protein
MIGRTGRGLQAGPRLVLRMADVTDRVEEHFRLFNEAVRIRDWTAFLATFTPDAVMSFEGVPPGRMRGWTRSPARMPSSRRRTR